MKGGEGVCMKASSQVLYHCRQAMHMQCYHCSVRMIVVYSSCVRSWAHMCTGVTHAYIHIAMQFLVSTFSKGVCPVMGKMPAQLTNTSVHLCLSSKVLASVSILLEDFISTGRISTSGAPAFLQASATCNHRSFFALNAVTRSAFTKCGCKEAVARVADTRHMPDT